jgi:hypothetical protein
LSSESLDLGRPLVYQAIVLTVVLVWGFFGGEQAQYLLLVYGQNPLAWYGFSLILVISLAAVLGSLSWGFRNRITIGTADWDFRSRELTLSEFQDLVKEYRRAYSSVLVDFDTGLLGLWTVLGISAVVAPPALGGISVLALVYSPYLFGAFLIGFGTCFALFVFRAAPSGASSEFEKPSPKDIERLVDLLSAACGISWAGVQIKIGEWEGLYTIRDVTAVGRIESIESAGRILLRSDADSSTIRLVREIELGDDSDIEVFHLDARSPRLELDLARSVLESLDFYARVRESDPILREIMEEVEECLKEQPPDESSDALISEEMNGTKQTRGKDGE